MVNQIMAVESQISLVWLQLKTCILFFRLEVWPGYVSSIARYAGGLLLQLDVSHRVLRTETCLDVM